MTGSARKAKELLQPISKVKTPKVNTVFTIVMYHCFSVHRMDPCLGAYYVLYIKVITSLIYFYSTVLNRNHTFLILFFSSV